MLVRLSQFSLYFLLCIHNNNNVVAKYIVCVYPAIIVSYNMFSNCYPDVILGLRL